MTAASRPSFLYDPRRFLRQARDQLFVARSLYLQKPKGETKQAGDHDYTASEGSRLVGGPYFAESGPPRES